MNRRDFLKTSALSAAFAITGHAASAKRPNLIIIQTDEHNFRTLGCYRDLLPEDQALMWGSAVVETPHIDSLADAGALCTSFYATTPVCSPSRAAFVSGRYPQNTPVTTNGIPLSDDVVTFAEILRRSGYATGYAGKWHLDGQGKPQWQPKRTFGFTDNRYMYNRGHWKQLHDTAAGPRVKARKDNKPTYDVKGADEQSFTTDYLTDKTIDFIKSHKNEPFSYMVSIPDPHGPDTVRPPYDTMYADQQYTKPRTFDKPTENLPTWAAPNGNFNGMAKYYGMVKCIDDNVGRILATLKNANLTENTIVVFTADHGDLRGEHHRQNKGVPFEGSAKVPFVLRWPRKVKPATVVENALSCVDFLPTVLAMMNVKTARLEQGVDASALFLDKKSTLEDIAFIRSTGTPTSSSSSGWLAAITSRYKLIYSGGDNPWLFDLEKDPDELINHFTKPNYRDIVRDLSRKLRDYGRKYNDPYINITNIKSALLWAIEGAGPYKPLPPKQRPAPARKKR